MLLDLRLYKLAKIFVKDLPEIIKRIDTSLAALEPFQRYKPVALCLIILRAQKGVLQFELGNYSKLLKEKGNIG